MSRIRRMEPADLPRVVEIEKSIFSQPWSEQGFLQALTMPGNEYVVAEQEGQIVGYCGYYGTLDEGEITNVAVKEEFRCRGIGGEMVGRLLQHAKTQGIDRMVLEVRLSNVSAIHVYEKLGFVKLGVRKNFYEMPTEDALIMECALQTGKEKTC
ncbi:MAG: ribosomal protein S18-alanine N-acetyltransferase [Lachnospiraceae bacterium]